MGTANANQQIVSPGWAGRTVSGWIPPSNTSYVLLRFYILNFSGSAIPIDIKFSSSENSSGDREFSRIVPNNANRTAEIYYHFISIPAPEGEAFYAWYDKNLFDRRY